MDKNQKREARAAEKQARKDELAKKKAAINARYEAKRQALREKNAVSNVKHEEEKQARENELAKKKAAINAKYEAERQALRERGIKKASGKVLSKTTEIRALGVSAKSVHHIVFELSDGIRMSLIAEPKDASLLMEGDVGMLTYRENKKGFFFVDFQRTS